MRAPAAQLYRVIFLLILRLPFHKQKKKNFNDDDYRKNKIKTCPQNKTQIIIIINKHSLIIFKMSNTKSYYSSSSPPLVLLLLLLLLLE